MANYKKQKVKQAKSPSNQEHAGFIRRLGAYFFDFITLIILLSIASILAFVIVLVADKIGIITIASNQSISEYLSHNLIFVTYLALVTICFYGYFWSVVGQTFGMKACNLRIQNKDQSNITFTQTLIRMATSAFGLGNFSTIYHGKNAFQDLWAECEVIVLTTKK